MMNKFTKTILFFSIAIFGVGFLFVPSVQAGNMLSLDIEFENTPLFNQADFKPGDSITRWVKVTNNLPGTQPIATEAITWPGFPNSDDVPIDDLSRALLIVISEQGGSDLYGGTSATGSKSLYNFYQDSEIYQEIYLSEVNTGQTIQYNFTISFPLEKENEWQIKTTGFDIIVGSQGSEGGPTPPSPPSPPLPPGGGGGLPCGLTIQYENTVCVSDTDVIITWLTSYNSTSRVVYDIEPNKFVLSSLPNYGYVNSTVEQDTPANINGVTGHTVKIITGLTPGTTYYYRCISHASPATIGTEHHFTTLAVGERHPCCEKIAEEAEEAEEEEEEQEEIFEYEDIIAFEKEKEEWKEEEKKKEEIIISEIIDEQEKQDKEEIIEEEGITKKEEEIIEEDNSRFLATIANFFVLENYCLLLTIFGTILACLFVLSKNKKKYYWILIFGIISLIILSILLKCLLLIIPIVILIIGFLITLLKKRDLNI